MQKLFKQQRGYGLVELSIASVLALVMSAAALLAQARSAADDKAKLAGQHMLTINTAIGTYMVNNYSALLNGTAVAGVADPYHPTIAELVSLGALTNNFGPRDVYGNLLTITVTRVPLGCLPAVCNLASTLVSAGPVTDPVSGNPDPARAGIAANAAGDDAGFSTTATPASISGPAGSWTFANPVGAVRAVLGMRNGQGTSTWNQFLRADGTRLQTGTQQGDFNVQSNVTAGGALSGNSVTATTSVTAGSSVSAATTVSAGTNITAGGSITATGGLSGATITTTGNGAVGGNLSVASNASVGGTLSAANVNATGTVSASKLSGQWVNFSSAQTVGGACTGSGLGMTAAGAAVQCVGGAWQYVFNIPTAAAGSACGTMQWGKEVTTSELLVCRSGVLYPIAAMLGDRVSKSTTIVSTGGSVAKPSCSYGGVPVIDILGNENINTSANGIMNVIPYNMGSSWQIAITDGTGASIPGIQVYVRTSCYYS